MPWVMLPIFNCLFFKILMFCFSCTLIITAIVWNKCHWEKFFRYSRRISTNTNILQTFSTKNSVFDLKITSRPASPWTIWPRRCSSGWAGPAGDSPGRTGGCGGRGPEQEQNKFDDLRRGITEYFQRLAKFQRTLSKSTQILFVWLWATRSFKKTFNNNNNNLDHYLTWRLSPQAKRRFDRKIKIKGGPLGLTHSQMANMTWNASNFF